MPRPFNTSSSQFADWTVTNCDHCRKSGSCEIESALAIASLGDGTITDDIATRMTLSRCHTWRCGEFEPKAQHKQARDAFNPRDIAILGGDPSL